jgi:uncharacterized Zn finger protein
MIGFKESDIRTGATSQSYQRGAQHYNDGYVGQLTQRGNLLTAQVEGSTLPYYQVTVTLADAGGIDDASCTCPYDWGGYCKHIVAVVEAWGEGISDLEEWIYEANEDAFSEAGQELSLLLAEALLSMDLAPEQRAQWYARAEAWEDGIDLDILETALDQWWDYPPLVAAMQGNISDKGAWEGEAPYFADELTLARLRILQRQGRIEEYIHLAEAGGQTSLYINMLARSGQVERAVAEAQQYLVVPVDVLSLAQALVEQGEPTSALAVAAHGLGLSEYGDRRELARWTVAQAEQAGDRALALRAAQVAFMSGLALDDYKAAERLAGADWPMLKTGLLAQIGEPGVRGNPLDVYLYEQMWVEAMALIDRSPWGGDLQRVIELTRADYPDWGIQHCKRQADSIMDAKKAKDYDRAGEWLRIARYIFRQHHREAEWQAYLRSLLAIHERKYKLVPMLRAIMT